MRRYESEFGLTPSARARDSASRRRRSRRQSVRRVAAARRGSPRDGDRRPLRATTRRSRSTTRATSSPVGSSRANGCGSRAASAARSRARRHADFRTCSMRRAAPSCASSSSCFPHTKGKWAGKRAIHLEPWQVFFAAWCSSAGCTPRRASADSGKRTLCVPRKNGKSIDAAGDRQLHVRGRR
jgi:hypothetical protein